MINPMVASAVSCSGSSCDNKGPVATGCNADGRAITSTEYDVWIMYSPACRAVWALSYSTPLFNCVSLQIERAAYDGAVNLVVNRRLSIQFCPGETKEWTNMLATGNWYFRGVWNDTAQGHPDSYSPWVYK